jgi:hypothetical protein
MYVCIYIYIYAGIMSSRTHIHIHTYIHTHTHVHSGREVMLDTTAMPPPGGLFAAGERSSNEAMLMTYLEQAHEDIDALHETLGR